MIGHFPFLFCFDVFHSPLLVVSLFSSARHAACVPCVGWGGGKGGKEGGREARPFPVCLANLDRLIVSGFRSFEMRTTIELHFFFLFIVFVYIKKNFDE